jgi:hypothetical protein
VGNNPNRTTGNNEDTLKHRHHPQDTLKRQTGSTTNIANPPTWIWATKIADKMTKILVAHIQVGGFAMLVVDPV